MHSNVKCRKVPHSERVTMPKSTKGSEDLTSDPFLCPAGRLFINLSPLVPLSFEKDKGEGREEGEKPINYPEKPPRF